MRKFFLLAAAVIILTTAFFLLKVKKAPRLVILYATCSLNKNYLQPYNSAVRYTPNFESFGKHSVIFTKYETEVGCSGPAYASLFSGNHVYRHGVYYQPRDLDDRNYLIAEAFRDNGFQTFFWNAHPLASVDFNYGQGVDPQNVIRKSPVDGQTLTERDRKFTSILARLKVDSNAKAFIQINFSMTHSPYYRNSNIAVTQSFCAKFPDECKDVNSQDLVEYSRIFANNEQELRHHFESTVSSLQLTPDQVTKLAKTMEVFYKSSVYLLDHSFGETIEAIRKSKLLGSSLIAFTSDHGEVLYRENSEIKWGHCSLDPEVLSPPLMIRADLRVSPYLYKEVTSSVDVFPTMARLSGLKISSNQRSQGTDLSPELLKEISQSGSLAYSCSVMAHPGVYNDDPRLITVIARSENRFYELLSPAKGKPLMRVADWTKNGDVQETVFDPRTDQKITEGLKDYKRKLIQGYMPSENSADWEEEKERLRSLGYIK